MKKFITALVVALVAISSASALSFELTVNQGFPIEYLKLPSTEDHNTSFEPVYYKENSKYFVGSTGLEASCYLFKNIGVDVAFDFAYTNKVTVADVAFDNPIIPIKGDQTTSGNAWYLKVAPAFKFETGKFGCVLTPGFTFGGYTQNINTVGSLGEYSKNVKVTKSQTFPFGLGAGVKFTYAFNNHMKLNLGCDLDFMLVANAATTNTSSGDKASESATIDGTDKNMFMNVMPKIGFSYVF